MTPLESLVLGIMIGFCIGVVFMVLLYSSDDGGYS